MSSFKVDKPVQLPLDFGPYALVSKPVREAFKEALSEPRLKYRRPDCPRPLRHASDQFRCIVCSIIWDVDEARPFCHTDDASGG
jgi:hypothetical protein